MLNPGTLEYFCLHTELLDNELGGKEVFLVSGLIEKEFSCIDNLSASDQYLIGAT